ncbi:hypothetical protein L4174_024015 (plasmid) [Photobacterium sp. CCB-ST2H9]|uniref:hypothetical protein n=1 Tax=Photobacterium sp. CCB-ST2H9 TaxID=2912855 RepID=UPI002003376E|nr:hypothetical protein [Photobacterium sp. CCB-ST2H9]UTM60453.1 hypothetical protein L4174_024015 [Photobacterium sp. CCB-ST2H9]
MNTTNFASQLDPVFLNKLEAQIGTFEPEFLDIAMSFCLPILPNIPTKPKELKAYKSQLVIFLSEYFDVPLS